MPSSQPNGPEERRTEKMITHEPPKLKTILKTPPKQATNPMQFVKVGPCSLYRTAQEQLQKVQEVKKVKQEIRDDPEDWQSNLDNWKSSRRKRQEHIIERVVEVKKLELEEHDRHRRKSKTFSEMIEERNNRGSNRKLSISLAMYQEEDSNDLSDLGIGTSSGKSSISGDTHDDNHSVLSDRDSELDKSQSDVDNGCSDSHHDNGNGTTSDVVLPHKNKVLINNGFCKNNQNNVNNHHQDSYDSATTATASSPEPEEYTYEGAIRNYVSRVAHNIPRSSIADLDAKLENVKISTYINKIHNQNNVEKNSTCNNSSNNASAPVIKIDINKRKEIFEKGSLNSNENNNNVSNNRIELSTTKSIKERLSSLERQKSEINQDVEKGVTKENLREKPSIPEELESVRPLRERLSNFEKLTNRSTTCVLIGSSTSVTKEQQVINNRNITSTTSSERSSSPDSEYQGQRAAFHHQSLDSLDADASSGPDTFERVQSLEDFHLAKLPLSTTSAELLNDTDREDSGIHTADVSCSVSQADEPFVEEEKTELCANNEKCRTDVNLSNQKVEEQIFKTEPKCSNTFDSELATTEVDIPFAGTHSAYKNQVQSNVDATNYNCNDKKYSFPRTIIYQSPKIPNRKSPPEIVKTKIINTPVKQIPKTGPIYKESLSPTDNNFPTFPSNNDAPLCSLSQILNEKTSPNEHSVPTSPQELKSPPFGSPRLTSKIPTSLTRKSPVNSLTSLSSSPVSPMSPKLPMTSPSKRTPTKIPIPSIATSPKHPTTLVVVPEDEQQKPIVEVCKKVVVQHIQMPSTQLVTTTPMPIECLDSEDKYEVMHSADDDSKMHEQQENKQPEEQKIINTTLKSKENQGIKEITTITAEFITKEKQEVDKSKEVAQVAPTTMAAIPRPTTLMLKSNLSDSFSSPLSPVSKQILPLSFSSDEEIVTGLSFPLGPPTSVEPPKEKPPPPPTELSDEENVPIEPLKRLNSTRRIKKEIRSRRSDFLGIEGVNDEDLERELSLTKPPDMAAILAEERRIEQLHRRSYDTDSNYEQDSSHERDSGVELGHVEDWTKQPISPDMSQHSRQSSEPFGASVTSSEEDEITKKEREIIDVLEKEEQWRYGSNRQQNSDIGEKLAYKLRELEEEKMILERKRAIQEAENHRRQEEKTLRKNEENLRKQEELIQRERQEGEFCQQESQVMRHEEKVRLEEKCQNDFEEQNRRAAEARRQEEKKMNENLIQETKVASPILSNQEGECASREVLRVERELLQLEQEELKRQRTNLAYREQKQQQLALQLEEQWKSLQDVTQTTRNPRPVYNKPQLPLNYRSSLPNLQVQEVQRRRPPPPPIPPAKPLRLVERQKEISIRNSRVPSADSLPQLVETPLRQNLTIGQQMSRQTLQALSAAPRSRIVQGDQWLQRRKSDIPRATSDYNYQHWLIQEAEHRRISDHNQRSPPTRKPHITGTSVPYSTTTPVRNDNKPLPDSIIQTLTQRVQNRVQEKPLPPRRRLETSSSQEHLHTLQNFPLQPAKLQQQPINNAESQEKMLSVSGKKKCSHCGDELGRGAAMIIESLRLFYHMECFKCCVCHVRLGDGLMGTDVRVRNHKLHCHNCYSSDDGVKFSCV